MQVILDGVGKRVFKWRYTEIAFELNCGARIRKIERAGYTDPAYIPRGILRSQPGQKQTAFSQAIGVRFGQARAAHRIVRAGDEHPYHYLLPLDRNHIDFHPVPNLGSGPLGRNTALVENHHQRLEYPAPAHIFAQDHGCVGQTVAINIPQCNRAST